MKYDPQCHAPIWPLIPPFPHLFTYESHSYGPAYPMNPVPPPPFPYDSYLPGPAYPLPSVPHPSPRPYAYEHQFCGPFSHGVPVPPPPPSPPKNPDAALNPHATPFTPGAERHVIEDPPVDLCHNGVTFHYLADYSLVRHSPSHMPSSSSANPSLLEAL